MAKNKRLVAEISFGDEVIMNIDDNLLNAEFGALDRGNLTDVVDWGIYANRGSLSFIDRSGYFNNYNVNSYDIKSATVRFYLKKTLSWLVATFAIESVSFDDETKQVDIELMSTLSSWQNKKIESSIFPFEETTVSTLLSQINERFGTNIVVGEDSTNIYQTTIYCPYLQADSLWNTMTKLCQATMCRIVEDEYGNAILTGSFPEKSPVVVNPNSIISIVNGGAISLPNISIESTKRQKYYQTQLDEVSRKFYISYDENGNPLENNDDYTFVESDSFTDIEINSSLTTSHPIRGIAYGVATNIDTVERLLPRGDDEPVSGGSYSRTVNWSPGVINDNKVILNFFTNAVSNIAGVLHRLTSIEVVYKCDYFEDSIDTQTAITDIKQPITTIPSNDLIQTESFSVQEDSAPIMLPQYILREVGRRYRNIIECFEIECLFSAYYDKDGNLVFDRNYMSDRFKKYDLIEPYVMKIGERVPLRQNTDGTPKIFRIVGISYSYDGFLRQKLSVQEERYDA